VEDAGLRRLLAIAAAGEALTGVALLASPALVARVLLGAEVTGVGVAVARVTGIALFALAVACWPGPAARGMLVYGGLVTAYLAWLGIRGEWSGRLLWPAVAAHAALTVALARALRKPPEDKRAQ
jgi:hypothetical protein